MFKIYILSHWRSQIDESDLENKHLQRAGKWLWIINRDGYLGRVGGELPQPKNYHKDFKRLADDLKVLVLKIRTEIKREIEKERIRQKELDKNRNEQNWLDSQGIDINKCNDWERNFLDTMYKAYNNGWVLSEKQENRFNKIKNEKSNKQDVEANQNLSSVAIVNDVWKNTDNSQLNDWEKDFMESITQQVDSGRILSQKQSEILAKIDEKLSSSKEVKDYSNFVGKSVNAWLINELTGNWVSGVVKFVQSETKLAILCDVVVEGDLEKLEEIWVPKSQLTDDIIL